MKRILISVLGVFVMAGCSVNSNDLNSPGEVQSALDDASIACEEASLRELPGETSSILMTCKDGSVQQRNFSFIIWQSAEQLSKAIANACEAPLSPSDASELVSIASTVFARSNSLLVDVSRISEAISGKTTTLFDHCVSEGFAPIIEDSSAELVEVPDVIGMPYQQALELLESNGLLVLRVFEKSDVAEGAVLRAAPQAGTSVAEGTAITLYVSSGE